jgi:O-antigen/teichoic acid export membrane protein
MSIVQTISKNTAVQLLSTLIAKLFAFFSGMYAARFLGANGFGILSFALAFTAIISVFADLGLQQIIVRDVARNKSLAEKYLGNIIIIKIILSIFTFIITAIIIHYVSYPDLTIKIIYLITLSVIFNSFSFIFYSITRAFERMEYLSLGQVLSSALMFAGTFFIISHGFDVIGFAFLYCLIGLVILLYSSAVCSWKFVSPKIEFDLSFCKIVIKDALPFGLSSIFVAIYYWINSIMLSSMTGNEVVGWYSASYRLILTLMVIPNILQISIFPATSRLYESSEDLLKKVTEIFFKYMIVIGVPMGVGTTLLSKEIVLFLFGVDYMPSILALQILIWGVIFAFIVSPFENLILSINKQFINTVEVFLAMILNIIINILLIPKYGLVGAAIATTSVWIFEFIFVFSYVSNTKYKMSKKLVLSIAFKALISSSIMGIFILYFTNSLFIIIICSVFVYFIASYAIGLIDREDISLIKEVIFGKVIGNEK